MPQSQSDATNQATTNIGTQSSQRLTLGDFKQLFHLTKEGKGSYRGECPICETDLLYVSQGKAKLVVRCNNGCPKDEIMAVVRTRKREETHSPVSDSPESNNAVPEGAQITYPEMDADPDSSPDPSWEWKTQQFEQALGKDKLQVLAKGLGVGEQALGRLRVGWLQNEGCYTFPEVNEKGEVIGICRRFEDGEKQTMAGSRRGLYVPADWDKHSGPLLLPEGASDAAAAISMDLSAIGRPSATGGGKLLAKLLKDFPKEREIIVLGDMDASHTGKWIGRDEAVKLATVLAGELGRPVHWALPPEGKDIREFLRRRAKGTTRIARRREFLEGMKKTAVEPGAARLRLEVVSAADLLKQKIDLEWAVKRLLVRGQPVLMGGPQKALKTTLALDLAISLATGQPFLGQKDFAVPTPLKVCMLSGESGQATIQRTIRDQLRAKNFRWKDKPDVLKNLHVGFRLPLLSVTESVKALEELLVDGKFDVLIIDPLYLCLLARNPKAQASSMFDMGPLLMNIAELCQRHGVTPILLHHFPKGKGQVQEGKSKQPPELEDLAFAGISEFARQWILIGRRRKYEPGTGNHHLWLSVGGSAGFSSCWALDIDQGVMKEDFKGMGWSVTVRSQAEQIEADKKAKATKDRVKEIDKKDSDWIKIKRFLKEHKDGETQTAIEDGAHVGPQVIKRLFSEGSIVPTKVRKPSGKKSMRWYDGYKLAGPAPKVQGITGDESSDEESDGGETDDTEEDLDDLLEASSSAADGTEEPAEGDEPGDEEAD